ncbi:MAG: class II fructose-bisphosphate aldolase [Anaerolineaceae bacterium]|nr:class II fructose-bisphosphate aldolase [Anaerolineaceae bacterium]
MLTSKDIVKNAHAANIVIPAFNVPYLPMVEPVIKAVVDQDCFAFIEVARLEWIKFQSGSLAAVMAEYKKWEQPDYVRLHLDHVPVIDEDELSVDYRPIIAEAIELGYHSVMIDGSRLDLAGNIAATRQVAELAHAAGIPCEAELGAVMGHAAGPLPPYEELYASGLGFTDVDEARQFVQETGCDWLSVAIGSIHGAVSGVSKDQKKVEARLNLEHLAKLQQATGGIPFVLHGGSGVKQDYLLAAIKKGIAKVNIGTEIRQAYETALRETGHVAAAQEAAYQRTAWLIKAYFGLAGTRRLVTG